MLCASLGEISDISSELYYSHDEMIERDYRPDNEPSDDNAPVFILRQASLNDHLDTVSDLGI